MNDVSRTAGFPATSADLRLPHNRAVALSVAAGLPIGRGTPLLSLTGSMRVLVASYGGILLWNRCENDEQPRWIVGVT
ncbi:hypothetical protein [Actinoplanes sp. NPDC049599]|uniref:hypothetical protein n=1 Tax=Actinoplanes sp. NPDC049599 TaxID=3363903 RepID=UPI0037B3B272